MDIMELRISFWVLSLLCYDVKEKTSPQLAATLLVFFNCNFTMKYERNSYVNKRYSNEIHSHVGGRLHQVGDVLFKKMLSCGPDLSDENILDIFSQYDGRSKVEDMEKAISMLEELIASGHDTICVRRILRSKRKILANYFVSPTNTPPSSDDEEDLYDTIDQTNPIGRSLDRDGLENSELSAIGSGVPDDPFRSGLRTATSAVIDNTPIVSVAPPSRQKTDSINICSTRICDKAGYSDSSTVSLTSTILTDASVKVVESQENCCHNLDKSIISAAPLDDITEEYQANPIGRSLNRDVLENGELSGIGSMVNDVPFRSGILTDTSAPNANAQCLSVQSLDDSTVSGSSFDKVNEKHEVPSTMRLLDRVHLEDIELSSGGGAVYRADLLIQVKLFGEWCVLKARCILFSLFLLGLCVSFILQLYL